MGGQTRFDSSGLSPRRLACGSRCEHRARWMTPVPRKTRRRSRRSEVEAWWPIIREIAAFGLGVFLLVWQNSLESSAQIPIVTAGAALVGVPVVGAFQRALRSRDEES